MGRLVQYAVGMIGTDEGQWISTEFHPAQIVPAFSFEDEFLAAFREDEKFIGILSAVDERCRIIGGSAKSAVTHCFDEGRRIAALRIDDLRQHEQSVGLAVDGPIVRKIPLVLFKDTQKFPEHGVAVQDAIWRGSCFVHLVEIVEGGQLTAVVVLIALKEFELISVSLNDLL